MNIRLRRHLLLTQLSRPICGRKRREVGNALNPSCLVAPFISVSSIAHFGTSQSGSFNGKHRGHPGDPFLLTGYGVIILIQFLVPSYRTGWAIQHRHPPKVGNLLTDKLIQAFKTSRGGGCPISAFISLITFGVAPAINPPGTIWVTIDSCQ